MKGNNAVAFKYRQAQRAVLDDTNEALANIGRDAQYAKARGDWARAKRLEDQYEYIKTNVLPPLVKGAAGGAALYGGYRTLSDLLGNMR